MKSTAMFLLVLTVALIPSVRLSAHCEMPCGIYDDPARFGAMKEDAATIKKAIDSIRMLADNPGPNEINQLGRWITTKEEHATSIQEIIAQYFMTQRIKADAEGYVEKLTKAHAVMVAAMKCKQAADPATVQVLTSAIQDFQDAYGSGQ